MPASTSDATCSGLTCIILTFNSEGSLEPVVRSVTGLADRIIVVDSGSTDRTVDIARELGCQILTHPFENYGAQRRWAQTTCCDRDDQWVLHLDADEVVDARLAGSIRKAIADPRFDAYLMQRLAFFMAKPIRWGHMRGNYHLRLFRNGSGRCESRLYDQHFLSDRPPGKLEGTLLDLQMTSLENWTASHNRWSSAEAAEALQARGHASDAPDTLQASLSGSDPRTRKRWAKNRLYYRLPLFVRPFLFYLYSYVLRLGFLDGVHGFIYHFLQAFWFRFLVDAKIWEATTSKDYSRYLDRER